MYSITCSWHQSTNNGEFSALSGSTAMIFQNGATGHNFNLDNIVVTDLAPAGSGMYSERLNGSTNEKYGLAKSLSVMPGDTVNLEVYGKYIDSDDNNWTGALTTLMGQIAGNTAGVVVDGASYSTSTSSFPFTGLLFRCWCSRFVVTNNKPRVILSSEVSDGIIDFLLVTDADFKMD